MHQAYKCLPHARRGFICQRRTTGGYNSSFHPRFHTEERKSGSQSWKQHTGTLNTSTRGLSNSEKALLWLSTSSTAGSQLSQPKALGQTTPPTHARHFHTWLQVTDFSCTGGDVEKMKSHRKPLL